MKTKYIIFQVRVDELFKENFKLYATKNGMTVSECARYIIRKAMEEDYNEN